MPSAPPTTYSFLAAELSERDAAGFVSVADRTDPGHRYLTRYQGPPTERYAFVFVDGRSYLCAPDDDGDRAAREFAGSSVLQATDQTTATPGERAAEVLDGHDAAGTILVPQHVPHDAAVYLQQAEFDVQSSAVVDRARTEKSRSELDCLAAVQEATTDAMAAVETVLARAEVSGRELRLDGRSITTARLRRIANTTLAEAGVNDAGNTVVATGPVADRRRFQGDLPVRPGEPVVVVLQPRGPHGYHGFLARTFVPDTDGGWDRRAHLAATGARDAGVDEAGPGVAASSVVAEIAAEAHAFGFDENGRDGFDGATAHGVGLAPVEAPYLTDGTRGADQLTTGHVLALGGRIVDPDEGCIRVGDLAFVTDDGATVPVPYPDELVPRDRGERVTNRP